MRSSADLKTAGRNPAKIIDSVYSRLPVGEGSLDEVAGIVQAKGLLGQALTDRQLDLRAALITPQFVPESTEALKVLEMFRESGVHIALVIDEFGGLQGLVTLQDIIEGIVGDLPGEGEAPEPEVIQREDGSWLMDGSLPVDELKEILDLSTLPQEDRGVYQTLGGFIMTHLGRIPEASDHFEWSGLHFEVMDMDGFRVDKVLVQPISPEDAGPISEE
jgi:putative hemolysin